jgi:hypothetical protein
VRCSACGGELILTSVVPDETAPVRGVEHHTFVCSACHVTECRVVFTRHGREDDAVPLSPTPAGPGIRRVAPQEEHAGVQGLLERVVARLRGQ